MFVRDGYQVYRSPGIPDIRYETTTGIDRNTNRSRFHVCQKFRI